MIPLIPIAINISLAVAVAIPGIVAHEKVVTRPYTDIAGVRTVCAGETQGIEEREYSETECLMMAATRLEKDFAVPIRKCTPAWDKFPLQIQISTLSLAYNIGTANYCRSSSRKAFVAGDMVTGCHKMLLWNKARVWDDKAGKRVLRVVKGLQNRREAEYKLCMEGVS